MASLLLGLVFLAGLLALVVVVNRIEGPATEGQERLAGVLAMGVQLNCIGAAFNMIPCPPLDGSHVLEFFLPAGLRGLWRDLERNAWMIFAILMFTGALGWMIRPAMDASGVLVEFGIELGKRLAHG